MFYPKIKLWGNSDTEQKFGAKSKLQENGSELDIEKFVNNIDLLLNEFKHRFSDFSSFEDIFALFSAPFRFDASLADESSNGTFRNVI